MRIAALLLALTLGALPAPPARAQDGVLVLDASNSMWGRVDGRPKVAIAREALRDPYWPRRAAEQLGLPADYADWPERHGTWLAKREEQMGGVLRARREAAARAVIAQGRGEGTA